jgi:Trk K+ transport system NAD-binding subunit
VERPVVLCGLGRVGWRVLDSFKAAGLAVIVVDIHVSPDDPRLQGVKAVKGDCRQPGVLEQAGIKDAGGAVIVTSDDLVNISTALLIRRLNPSARIIVRMFNQNLLTRLGSAVKNTVALSVSALTAPLLALAAVTGDALGTFKLEDGPRQISELVVADTSDLSGKRIVEIARVYNLIPLVFTPQKGPPQFLLDVVVNTILTPGDRLVVCGIPGDIRRLLARERGDLFPGVRWAGTVRRWLRTARRTLLEVDLAVKIATPTLFLTILGSTLVFRYGLGLSWSDGLYSTVSLVATGAELHGERHPEWAKVFLSVLKISGAALVAAFTAIFTQYLIRARLGGALEVRRVPDSGHVVVCGLGNIGYRLVNELTQMGERVVAIDMANVNPFIATVRRKGVPTFVGDATVAEVLKQVRAGSAKAVIAATSSELANLEIALLVQEMNPQQRIVLRLNDPQFAEAVREAADLRYAMSVPALAAPAFAAALFGDRVQTLFTTAGCTLVVIDVIVEPNEKFLEGKSLRALVLDYRLLPVVANGRAASELKAYRLKVGDRVTVVAELPELERFIRREVVPATYSVVVISYPIPAREYLITLVRATKHCTQDEAELVLKTIPFTLTTGLTRGEGQELVEQLTRESVSAQVYLPEKNLDATYRTDT